MAKAVRMSDIAQRLNVSTVTVSKALAGKDGVSEELRAEIQRIAEEMGYQKKSINEGKVYTFGIITPHKYIEKGHSFYWTLYERIMNYLSQRGHIGVLEIISDQNEQMLELPRLIQNDRIDGVILMGNFSEEYCNHVEASGTPMVMLDSFDARYSRDTVISDGYYGMYTMVHHLLQMGHRDIVYVGSVGETSSITDRYFGFCRAMIETGITVSDDMVIPDRDSDGKIEISIKDIRKMPTAFACNCDSTAYILMKLLKSEGIRIPEDVSIVGFDNFILSELADPQITTYAIDIDRMAKEACTCLIRRLRYSNENAHRIVVSGTLVVRDSVRSLK